MFLFEIKNFLETKIPSQNVFVTACDRLPNNFQLPAGFIINTSRADEVGTHWVALYIDSRGAAYYFDSFGFPPQTMEIQYFIRLHSRRINFNKQQLQRTNSRVCGFYATIFLYYILALKLSPSHFLSHFSYNLVINDGVINRMYHKFNV